MLQVGKAAANAAARWVDPRWALAVPVAAASPRRLPSVVPLPPYPARQATAPSRLALSGPPVQRSNATPRVQPGRPQPPRMVFQTFGGPATSACLLPEQVLVDLSPPTGHSANPRAQDQGARPEAIRVQNVARRPYSEQDHLSMQIPEEFDANFPPLMSLHLVEAYHRSKDVSRRKSPRCRHQGQVCPA